MTMRLLLRRALGACLLVLVAAPLAAQDYDAFFTDGTMRVPSAYAEVVVVRR